MSEVTVKPKTFFSRLNEVYKSWREDEELWSNAVALCLLHGSQSEALLRTPFIQTWLLGWEMPDVLMFALRDDLYILASASKNKILKVLVSDQQSRLDEKPDTEPTIHLLKRPSKSSGQDDTANMRELISKIPDEGVIGTLLKDETSGKFAQCWKDNTESFSGRFVDVANGFGSVMAIKDTMEIKYLKTAGSITSTVLKKHLMPLIETAIDQEKPTKHSELARKITKLFDNPQEISPKLSADVVDQCFAPIIQSGGHFDLKASAVSDNNNLNFKGVVLCALGGQYRGYPANIARSFFINPTQAHRDAYEALMQMYELGTSLLNPGQQFADCAKAIKDMVADKYPKYSENCEKSFGFSIGLGFRESGFVISQKCDKTIQEGMVLSFSVGLNRIPCDDDSDETFAVMVTDTVVITASGNEIITKHPMGIDVVSYTLEEEVDTKPMMSRILEEQAGKAAARKLRDRGTDTKKSGNEEKIREHQRKLGEKIQAESLRSFKQDESLTPKKALDRTTPKDINAYDSVADFPRDARSPFNIYVDHDAETVLLPIYGRLVPFHIKFIKNVSKTDNFLRINFVYPGAMTGVPVTLNDEQLASSFVRELTYQINDQRVITNTYRMIQELKKRVAQRDKEEKEKKSLKKQEKLIVDRRGNVPKLSGVTLRPSSRRSVGTLEAHTNGLRYIGKSHTVDILYKNIKHAFFQQAKKEVLVVLHFHLHDAILFDKKKAVDIQVCAEVMDGSERLDNVKKRWGDADEIEEENRQRRQLNKLNTAFHRFSQRVEQLTGGEVEFDVPFRDLGFLGVHHRANVLLQPSLHCLVQLIEMPFFVLNLSEVLLVNLERVQFRLRSFDMVVIFKDLNRTPVSITQIPAENLDSLQEWLDSCNIKFYSGPQKIQWNRVMKTICADPHEFFMQGGWSFLEPPSEEEAELDGEDDDFTADEDEEEFEEDSDEFEDDEDFSDEDEEEEYDEDEDEDAADWDELEKRAARADKKAKSKHGRYSDESD